MAFCRVTPNEAGTPTGLPLDKNEEGDNMKKEVFFQGILFLLCKVCCILERGLFGWGNLCNFEVKMKTNFWSPVFFFEMNTIKGIAVQIRVQLNTENATCYTDHIWVSCLPLRVCLGDYTV